MSELHATENLPASRAPRWAVSPVDLDAHLLAAEDTQPADALKARCAALLPVQATQYDRPTGPRLCPVCWVIFRAVTNPAELVRAQEQDPGWPLVEAALVRELKADRSGT